jgi:hypothetical protein
MNRERTRAERLVSSTPEELAGLRRIQELEGEIEQLKQKLKAEEAKEKRGGKTQKTKRQVSRREFLRAAALATGAILLKTTRVGESMIESNPEPSAPETKRTPEEEMKFHIRECLAIIEGERYSEVLQNPYLASALYYSDEYTKTIVPKGEVVPQEIIASVYPFITQEFRERYLEALKNKFEREAGSLDASRGPESLPLDSISVGKDLTQNHSFAIDLFIEEGSPIYSMTSGIVVLAENSWREDDRLSTSSLRGGNTVIVFDPREEKFYRYAHLERALVSAGDIIKSGNEIGTVGHSGINASKPGRGEHIHFEINAYNRARGIMEATNVFELERMLKNIKAGARVR